LSTFILQYVKLSKSILKISRQYFDSTYGDI